MQRKEPTIAIPMAVALSSIVFSTMQVAGQDEARRLPAVQVTIDEDILTAFVDQPCQHFEAARDQFVAGKTRPAAEHLRMASAFLRLEAARASADGRPALEASIVELGKLAEAVEGDQVRSLDVLQNAFARAHFALAGHHCIKSAHRCCQLESTYDESVATRAGLDLRAATTHFERGAMWKNAELDEQSRQTLQASRRAADQLIESGEGLRVGKTNGALAEVKNGIHMLHLKLESLTGHAIRLARPSEIDAFEPAEIR